MNARRARGLVLLALLLGACVSVPDDAAGPAAAAAPRLRVGQEEPAASTNFGREEDPVRLFVQLDRQLRNARDPRTNALARAKMRPVLTRYVNANTDLIVQALRGGNEKHRLVAAWSLGYSTDPRALPLLVELAGDRSPRIRANALHGLATLADPATPLRPLVACFTDADAGVRCNAARAVRNVLKPGEGVELIVPLTGLLTDEDPRVRLAAVGALGKIGRPECLGFLVNALKDEKPLIRSQAALGLGLSGDPAAVSHLMAALGAERHPAVVAGIVKALETLTGQSFQTRDAWLAWWSSTRP